MRGRTREGTGGKCAAEPPVLGQERIMIVALEWRGTCDGSELYFRAKRIVQKSFPWPGQGVREGGRPRVGFTPEEPVRLREQRLSVTSVSTFVSLWTAPLQFL